MMNVGIGLGVHVASGSGVLGKNYRGRFAGGDDRVDIGTINIGTGDFAVSFKANRDVPNTFHTVLSGSHSNHRPVVFDSGNKFRIRIGNTNFITSAGVGGDENIWTVNYDRSGNADIYKDGVLFESMDISIKSTTDLDLTYYIGSRENATEGWDGTLDDFYIFTELLSAGDIAALAAGGVPSTSPVRHYKFNAGEGTTIIDDAGNQDGTLENADTGTFWELVT